MRVTATQLATQYTCPYLRYVSYEVKEPLPVWGTWRRFGNVIHAAIAEYERRGKSLENAVQLLEEQRAGLTDQDLKEARSILLWRHERSSGRKGRPVLIEGSLRAQLGGHRLEVRMDRLDRGGGDYLLAEYKGGRTVDLELVRVQMTILAYAILDVFGRAPERWELELLRARQVLEIPREINPEALRRLPGRLLQDILEGSREPEPYDPRFCSRCPAKAYCPKHTRLPKPLSRAAAKSADPQLTLF